MATTSTSAGKPAGKLCGAGCGTLIPPGRGRQPGQTWYCGAPECDVKARRISYGRRRAIAGFSAPRTCSNCGEKYSASSGGVVETGICSRPGCKALGAQIRARIYYAVFRWLADNDPDRVRAIAAEQVAKATAR